MARAPRKHPGLPAVAAARDLAAALTNPVPRLLVRLAGPQTGLARLSARPPLLDVAPFGNLPEAAFHGQQPPAAAPTTRPPGLQTPRATPESRPRRTPFDRPAPESAKHASAPGPPSGPPPELNPRRPPASAAKRHRPEEPPAERRSPAVKASSRVPLPPKTAASPAATAAGLQLPVFGARQERADATVAPPPGRPAAALDPTGRLALLTDALFTLPDEGLDNRKPLPKKSGAPPPAARPRRRPLPPSALLAVRADGNPDSRPEGPKDDGAAAGSPGDIPPAETSNPAGAATAMTRIATLVNALLTPSANEAPADATAPAARATTPPGAPFTRHPTASLYGPPPGRRETSSPAATSPPGGWPDIERPAAATEPEELAELINTVLLDQARRHGVNLS